MNIMVRKEWTQFFFKNDWMEAERDKKGKKPETKFMVF